MKFIHTADWQIGMKAVHLRDKAESVRRARFQSARKVVELAASRKVDFIVLAGDTFEHPGIERAKVREIANLLQAAPCPVYVIPGNHDPALPGSVWEDDCWAKAGGVHLLRSPQPIDAPGATLYPCPAVTRTSVSDPTNWIAATNAPGIRIGIAHGSVAGHPDMEPCFPIPRDAPARLNLDYLALGHYHSTAMYEDANSATRMAYSGTHEQTGFQDRDSGNILLVEISEVGAPPAIERVRSGVLEWRTYDRGIEGLADLHALAIELNSLSDPEHTLVQCSLFGEPAGIDDESIDAVRTIVENRFLYGDFQRGELCIASSSDVWIEELPVGYLQKTALKLYDAAVADPPDEIAMAALTEFRRLWREVRA